MTFVATGAHAVPLSSAELLRVATCGSVDDGKSTLVGRLLHDAKAVLSDQLEAVERVSRERGDEGLDLSLLVDGLRAEREQGITIDVAYRYLATPVRDFVLADTPGHVQYTRNTVTGTSGADAVVVLVDVRAGVVQQTRRHLAVAALLRVPHVVLAVNKIDLLDYDQGAFDAVVKAASVLAEALGVVSLQAVPVSALKGDNVTEPSANTPWYSGPTLLGLLEALPVPERGGDLFRFPVQWVARPRSGAGVLADYRGYSGTVVSGVVRAGDEVVVQPQGRRATVAAVEDDGGPLTAAGAGAAVVIRLTEDVDISRGDLLASPSAPAYVTNELDVDVCWMAERPLRPGDRVKVRAQGALVRAMVTEIVDLLDLESGSRGPAHIARPGSGAGELDTNDIGHVRLRLAEQVAVDPYAEDRATGGLLLVDESSGDTLAAALVRGPGSV